MSPSSILTQILCFAIDKYIGGINLISGSAADHSTEQRGSLITLHLNIFIWRFRKALGGTEFHNLDALGINERTERVVLDLQSLKVYLDAAVW